ncbi:uncharacterized protein PF3D7_1120600-like [Planococcus citri]|uniref:uncharacterized protein PF3D7_1120600-like n=1 Tax=Planococcus citri TaxID=170843 RepID=UPI0031F7DF2A
MENVWGKLKTLKGRSWTEAKDILNKIKDTGTRIEEIVVSYKINSETLAEEDREIYGVYPKEEPFYLERCKLCSRLLKPSVINLHHDLHHKRNTNSAKKSSFISPSKRKYSKKGNKSTSEDDSESVISSETPSPAVDLQENSLSNLDSSGKEDAIVDIISVEEIPSEDSKPPTPGPQDLYEEFAVPNTDEVSNTFSSTSTSDTESSKSFSNSKSLLKLKITANKDRDSKSHSGTSLLEAHLLSNTKYNTADAKYRNSNSKFTPFSKNEAPIPIIRTNAASSNAPKSEELDSDSWKSSNFGHHVGSPKLKNETKISIPISALPQNVKIIGSLKKNSISKSTSLLKNNPHKLVSNSDSKEKLNVNVPGSTFSIGSAENTIDSPVEVPKHVDKTTKSKKNKKSKGKNRSARNIEFDPDKHCGVLIDENRRCLRSLTCKTHLISLRRAVEGRSKEFDKLLADHRASKELIKEQERTQPPNLNLSDPIISLPILTADKITGNTIQISSATNESEIIKIRVPNVITNPEIVHSNSSNYRLPQNDNNIQKSDCEKVIKKLSNNVKLSNSTNIKASSNIKVITPVVKTEPKPRVYENDIKISFVCSDMLYKVGGLLYMDRSRQAVRKCMDPLISKDSNDNELKFRRGNRRIADFLQPLKNSGVPQKVSVFNEENSENTPIKKEPVNVPKTELKSKVNEEIERMKSVLAASCKILNNLSTDDSAIKKLKIAKRLKRKCVPNNTIIVKKPKQEISDENCDINTLLSFDKSVDKSSNGEHFPSIPVNRFSFAVPDASFQNDPSQENLNHITNIMDNISYNAFLNNDNNAAENYSENETALLLQTFKDLENQICNTVGNNMQNLYATPTLPQAANNTYIDYMNTNTVPNNVEYKEHCENEFKVLDNNLPNFDESIAKNYSLIEEYCKSIATDELFMDDKTNFEFYENGGDLVNGEAKTNRSNEIVVVGENAFSDNERNVDNINRNVNDDGLNFDTHILNTYLSSISGESSTQDIADINFAPRQFDLPQVEPQENQNLTKENVYEEILTLNKQFQDSTAVKIDQPPTPTTVYAKAENEEGLNWLF